MNNETDSFDEDDEDSIMVINHPCSNPNSETFIDDMSSITNEDESLPMRQQNFDWSVDYHCLPSVVVLIPVAHGKLRLII